MTQYMADKKDGWSAFVDDRLKKTLTESAQAAYENGRDLGKDARFLFDAHRYARATALAILAEEEFCKAFILIQSVQNERWDAKVYNLLRSHASKQGLAEAVLNLAEWEKARARIMGGFTSEYPDEKKAKEIVAAAKKNALKPAKDYLKQDALYVSIFKDGKIKNLPKTISKETAESSLLFTEKFQDHVALLLGDRGALERFFKI